MELLIVSGLSGAGKSVAMNALEDIGFFCIDNVPAGLLPSITAFSKAGDNQLERVALSMDVRGCRSREQIETALQQLDEQKTPYKILFLDAPDDVLMRRYSETRRRHPISIAEGISTREARSFTAHIIQPIAASAARMMIHLTKFGSFFICYILSCFSVGRGCGRGPAVPPPPARKAVSPTPGALLRPGRCCQLPQSWQGRYRCGHSMR